MGISVDLLEQGIAVINYGDDCEYISYQKTRELLDLAKKEVAELFPKIDKFPLLILAKNMKGMSKNAVDLIHSEEVSSLINASSYVSEEIADSLFKRTFLRMYLWKNPPPYPFKIYAKKEECIAWLSEFAPQEFGKMDYLYYVSEKMKKDKQAS